MRTKTKATEAATTITTKVGNFSDLFKTWEYFCLNVGTSLDCAMATGILRNCVTWYIRDLEALGLLRPVFIAPDRTTGYKAKHYSGDPRRWNREEVSDE